MPFYTVADKRIETKVTRFGTHDRKAPRDLGFRRSEVKVIARESGLSSVCTLWVDWIKSSDVAKMSVSFLFPSYGRDSYMQRHASW